MQGPLAAMAAMAGSGGAGLKWARPAPPVRMPVAGDAGPGGAAARGCAFCVPVIGARTFFAHGPFSRAPNFLVESPTFMTSQLMISSAAAGGAGAGGWLMLVPYLLIFLVFWLFLIRPQQVRMKQHRAKIDAVKVRDQVVTAGGVVGKVTKVDADYVDVEIATGVKVKVVKSTLADIILPGGKPAND